MHVRLLDVVLGQGRMYGQRVGESLAQQLPGCLPRQLVPLLGRKLPGKGDLQLRVGAAILALEVVRRLPERVRIFTRELGHIARLDQLQAAALLVLAIAGDVLACAAAGGAVLDDFITT